MRQTVIAFTTTGNSPKQGHRLRELLAVELLNGVPTGRRLHQSYRLPTEPEGKTFAEQFADLDALVGDAYIVVHNGGVWRRFLRAELREIKGPAARRLLRDVVDLTAWAHSRFPKQRKDLPSLARKVGVTINGTSVGIARDAELIASIATHLAAAPSAGTVAKAAVEIKDEAVVRRTFGERVHFCWRVLTNRA